MTAETWALRASRNDTWTLANDAARYISTVYSLALLQRDGLHLDQVRYTGPAAPLGLPPSPSPRTSTLASGLSGDPPDPTDADWVGGDAPGARVVRHIYSKAAVPASDCHTAGSGDLGQEFRKGQRLGAPAPFSAVPGLAVLAAEGIVDYLLPMTTTRERGAGRCFDTWTRWQTHPGKRGGRARLGSYLNSAEGCCASGACPRPAPGWLYLYAVPTRAG